MSASVAVAAVYTVDEVAVMMKCSTKTIRRWVDRGDLPAPLAVPGTLRFRRHEIDAFIATGELPAKRVAAGKGRRHG